MKRILHFGGVLLALGMLLASCNIGVGDGQVSGDSVRNTSNVEGIVLKVNKIDNSRTILPADWTAETASKLTYVLKGKKTDESGSVYEPLKTFSYSQLMGGTATVNLELVKWDLKLTGYITVNPDSNPEADELKPCLEKELTGQNLSTGTKTVVFDLKPVETTEATGSVNVSISWLTDQPKRLEFGIYLPNTPTETIVGNAGRGNAIDSVETTPKKLNKILTSTDFSGTGDKHTANWEEEDNIQAGVYKFAAVFYNAETGGEVIGYHIDYLYIDGGNLSKATINYGDKFDELPDNPTWLAVETAFVPQEIPTVDTAVSGKYYAKFHWNDVSTNETGFELVITEEGKDDPYIINPEKLATSSLYSDKWYDGTRVTTFNPTTNPNTIDAGRTWVVLKLDTEKKYTAKIRAINRLTPDFEDTDDEDFCDNLNRTGDGQGRTYAPIVGTGKQFGMFSVNYKVNYAVDGSQVNKGSSTTARELTNYVVGFNYHSEQQQVLMTDDPNETPRLENQTFFFDHWQITKEDGKKEAFPVIPALHIKNLELEPVWQGRSLKVSVTFPSYAEAQDVKIVEDKNSDNPFTFKYDNDPTNTKTDKNTITVNAGPSLVDPQFELSAMSKGGEKIQATGAPGDIYGKITVSDHTWTWEPTERTTPGLYCLQITGKYLAGFDEDEDEDRELTLCGNLYIKVEN